jgi:hypothetical protein
MLNFRGLRLLCQLLLRLLRRLPLIHLQLWGCCCRLPAGLLRCCCLGSLFRLRLFRRALHKDGAAAGDFHAASMLWRGGGDLRQAQQPCEWHDKGFSATVSAATMQCMLLFHVCQAIGEPES